MPASGTVADAVMLWEPVMMCIPRIPAMMASIPANRTVRRRKVAARPDRGAVMVFLPSFGSCSFKGTGPGVCRIQRTWVRFSFSRGSSWAFRATIVDISAARCRGENHPAKVPAQGKPGPERMDYLVLKLYPAATTAARSAASSAVPDTVRREIPSGTRSTVADSTPGTAATAFSTVSTQWPQSRPSRL
jgi:hypothetical protein